MNGPSSVTFFCSSSYLGLALRGVELLRRRHHLLGDLGDEPVVAPGQRLDLRRRRSCRRCARRCRRWCAGRDSPGAQLISTAIWCLRRAVAGRSPASARPARSFTLMPAWPMVCCTDCAISVQRRDVRRGRSSSSKPFGIAGLGQQRLGLGDVELVGVVGDGAEEADRQEGLLHDEAALQEASSPCRRSRPASSSPGAPSGWPAARRPGSAHVEGVGSLGRTRS